VFPPLHDQTAGGLALNQDNLIYRFLVVGLIKKLLGLVLQAEKLADAILVPAQPAQILAPAALVKFEQKILVAICYRPKADRVSAGMLIHSRGF